ncbi:MAG: Uma2 family endonuclease [Rhodocyclaceae bacterium]|jgi:Uma2 family endonuclease|nr:Uma2 family endonuclease [Rhodocyclaceae bacterium]MBK6907942.1 Uma2 family endonuclease [Rhodocyclaceae bacterium]
MSTALEVREHAALPYHRWSVDDYHQMAQAGLLDETDRIELIEGALFDMAPIGSKHAFIVNRLSQKLAATVGESTLVSTQNPVRLGEYSEPQPDIALVKAGNYMDTLPTAASVLLIVEVSHTTLDYDRDVKLALYARHNIPEVWLLDVAAGELTIYCEPAEGQYRLIRKPTKAEAVSPLLVPEVEVSLAQILS